MKQTTITDSFRHMVDDVVEFSQYDLELADGLRWLDKLAQKESVSFYEKVYEVLYKHDVNDKAKEWLKTKQSSNTNILNGDYE